MPLPLHPRPALLWTLAGVLLSACGKSGGDDPAADSVAVQDGGENSAGAPAASAESPAVQPAQPAADPSTAPLSVADIERWEKGMAAELKAVQEAAAKMQAAKTGTDTMEAMMGVQEMATTAAGAQAAGVDENRYKTIRSNLSAVVSYLAPPEIGGIDTTMLSPAQRDELRQMNAARIAQMQDIVPSSVVEALRPRAAELKKREFELVGARLKGAGM